MKKLILITSCVTLFAAATYAQDTTSVKPQQQPQTTQQPKASDQMRNDQDMKGWTKVESTDVPANLRQTLTGTQYSGWETGTVYRNESGEYRLSSGDKNAPKTYYFDKNGKASTKPNGTNPH